MGQVDCPDNGPARAGCFSSTYAGAGLATVTPANCFGKTISFIVAEYTASTGDLVCTDKT